jgi:tetratricopeptide (TPR) repeat protein
MNLTAELIELRKHSGVASPDEYAQLCGELAKRLEKAGKYEQAREAIAEFWPDPTQPPAVENLSDANKAEMMLRVGSLAGWLATVKQIPGGHEFAKNIITGSVELFDRLGDAQKTAEAQGDLALCYWREGAHDEARIHVNNALQRLGKDESDLRAILLIRAGIVEVSARRLNEALRLFSQVAPLVEKSEDHSIKGSFHIQYGLVFRQLAAPENREDYIDRALIEYAAASFHFEMAGNERALARVENNLGFLFHSVGRYKEAHAHLNRARGLFTQLKDHGTAAKCDETRSRTLLAEGRLDEAERLVRQAVRVLERGDDQSELADALTTYGVVTARLGRYARSRALLDRAIETALTAGDPDGAGRAKLSIIEELSAQTAPEEMAAECRSALQLLENSQDPAIGKRLIDCACQVMDALTEVKPTEPEVPESSWEGFSFKREVLKIEKVIIERALRDAGGSVTKASRLLGFRHHQSLIALINSRHRDLLGTRSAVRKRRRHLFSKPRQIKQKPADASSNGSSQTAGANIGDAVPALEES